MKQIEICLDRHFSNQKPLKAKWQARWHKENNNLLLLFHYQHLVLAYDVSKKTIEHEWWEVQADKRGLDAAKYYLQNM